ncbi:hypothetical protein GLV98_07640 [Halobacillus litoralis]|uniref:O-antigen ligase-related domain-containing protein n=1 Tax=Halobacillus litoralis TaxID=45668 RepID=A0A845E3G0_9BACI|nr:O-antigen ligase family protein [Halobacillus litoralis]MYL49352.1 hypothetical protein [Halobacillus litoralis]
MIIRNRKSELNKKNITRIINILFYTATIFLLGINALTGENIFLVIVACLLSIYILCFNYKKNIYLIFFLLPSLNVFISHENGFSYATIILLISFLKYIIYRFGEIEINNKFLIFFLLLVAYELLHMFNYSPSEATALVRWAILVLYAFILIADNKVSLNFRKLTLFFVFGIFNSGLLGLIGLFENDSEYYRFEGASGDPNGFGMSVLLAILFLINIQMKENQMKTNYIALIVIMYILGLMTLSRSFIIVSSIVFIIYFIYSLLSSRKIHRKVSMSIIGVSALITLPFFNEISNIIQSIYNRFALSNSMSELSGSRSLVVELYWEKFSEASLLQILFGEGLMGYLNNYNIRLQGTIVGPHNTYLEMIISWGILGSFLFVFFLWLVFRIGKVKFSGEVTFISLLPLFSFLFYLLSLQSLSKYITYFYLVLIIMNLYYSVKNKEHNHSQSKGFFT